MKILVVEDDPGIRDVIVTGLATESYYVDAVEDGERGSYLGRTNDYDLAILDLMLPKKDGSQICREIRGSGKTFPILMLSVNATTERKVDLLNYGADDYLTKPFSFKELLARVKALLRRPAEIEPDVLAIDDLIVDTWRQRVIRQEKEIYLTRKEFSLLEYLVRSKGRVVSRGMIMEHVWNSDSDPFSNTIEAHILNIRKKIELPKLRKLIETIPGRGYRVND